MSREIKFRAWSKKANRYLKITGIKYDGDEIAGVFVVYGTIAGIPNTIFIESDDVVVLEQYTGLKDKYGKEIYEGDVVALMYGYIPVKAYEKDQIKIASAQKAVVRHDDKKAAFRYTIIKQDKDCQFKFRTNESMVVIGNIHENPELLGGEE